jgi:hypothetical protein
LRGITLLRKKDITAMYYIKKYIVQAGLIGISLLAYINTNALPDGAKAFPQTLAIVLLVLVVLLSISTLLKQKKAEAGPFGKDVNPGISLTPKTMSILVGFIVFNALFVWLLPIIGFEIAGFLFILGGMIMLGGKAAVRYWWVSLFLPILLGVVFRFLLDLRLPLFPFMS